MNELDAEKTLYSVCARVTVGKIEYLEISSVLTEDDEETVLGSQSIVINTAVTYDECLSVYSDVTGHTLALLKNIDGSHILLKLVPLSRLRRL